MKTHKSSLRFEKSKISIRLTTETRTGHSKTKQITTRDRDTSYISSGDWCVRV